MSKGKSHWEQLATRNPIIPEEEQMEIQRTLEQQTWLVKLFLRSGLWGTNDKTLIAFFEYDRDGNNTLNAGKHLVELLWYSTLLLAIAFSLQQFSKDLVNHEFLLFQRSGAVLVFFALIASYVVDKKPVFEPHGCHLESNRFFVLRKVIKPSALTLAAVGTLIWAYGDLPFKLQIL